MPGNRKPRDKLTAQQDKFVRMEANDCSRADKLREIFGITDLSDARATNRADVTMSRWRRHPMYDVVWKEEVSRQDYSDFIKARRKLRESMDKKDDWLQMNAAVNVLAQTGKRIYAEEDRQVTVRIEGMPDLGSPDDDG